MADTHDWISANATLRTLEAEYPDIGDAIAVVVRRASAGLLKAKAAKWQGGDVSEVDALVPAWFWVSGVEAMECHWPAGDFLNWIEQHGPVGVTVARWQAFDVKFDRAQVESLIPEQPGKMGGPRAVRGRPPAPWWDDFWIEITRQIIDGELAFTEQSTLEKAMLTWAAANGHELSPTHARAKARKLFEAANKKKCF